MAVSGPIKNFVSLLRYFLERAMKSFI